MESYVQVPAPGVSTTVRSSSRMMMKEEEDPEWKKPDQQDIPAEIIDKSEKSSMSFSIRGLKQQGWL